MPIRIDRTSEIPVHDQLRQQIIFGIATGEFPIGHVMRSLNELARDLHVNRNTVGRVYSEMAKQRWLVQQKGRRMVVVHPKGSLPDPKGEDIETLIVRLSRAARAQDLATAQLLARVQELATVEPPDHFMVVEPEPGIGEVLKYEVQKATRRSVVSCSIPELRARTSLPDGAALLVPAYLADLIDFVPIRQRAAITILVYSPFGGFVEMVRGLAQPSVIGMMSVSGPGMKTMDGVFAESIGSTHRLTPFLLEWPPPQNGRPVVRRLDRKDLPPDIDIRLLGQPECAALGLNAPLPLGWASHLPLATEQDLGAVDVLFCDSIACNFVRHPQRITYELLSPESLRQVAAVKLAGARRHKLNRAAV
ncbi:MAG TPA: hypothetical protein VE779_02445 [Candidatus Angelobacter sp.]|nr:hypothetical protein [Candidatus Angelobacter sp.]